MSYPPEPHLGAPSRKDLEVREVFSVRQKVSPSNPLQETSLKGKLLSNWKEKLNDWGNLTR